MYANYHTHTVRCNHANGTEREYIEQAIARKLKVLGFSDHSPQVFDDYQSGFRMKPEQLEDYVLTLRRLQKEYADRINILIGLEVEYYPRYFGRLLDLIQPYELDYLILGQHFLGNESDGSPYSGHPSEDESQLEWYVNQTIEGMESGVFSCFAHPDLCNFSGDLKIYRKWYEKLCIRAKELGIPLELNMLGYADHRHYPNPLFFRMAHEVGNEIILGCDAHTPSRVADPDEITKCLHFLHEAGIEHPVEQIRLVLPIR